MGFASCGTWQIERVRAAPGVKARELAHWCEKPSGGCSRDLWLGRCTLWLHFLSQTGDTASNLTLEHPDSSSTLPDILPQCNPHLHTPAMHPCPTPPPSPAYPCPAAVNPYPTNGRPDAGTATAGYASDRSAPAISTPGPTAPGLKAPVADSGIQEDTWTEGRQLPEPQLLEYALVATKSFPLLRAAWEEFRVLRLRVQGWGDLGFWFWSNAMA